METFHLDSDLNLFCVPATSFPNGVKEAFEQLEKLLPTKEGRIFFGISHGSKDGSIIYKAAVLEDYKGEGVALGCEPFVLRKGSYLTEHIANWPEHMDQFQRVFEKLLADPRLDTNFPCVEWYEGEIDVRCMIRIDESKK